MIIWRRSFLVACYTGSDAHNWSQDSRREEDSGEGIGIKDACTKNYVLKEIETSCCSCEPTSRAAHNQYTWYTSIWACKNYSKTVLKQNNHKCPFTQMSDAVLISLIFFPQYAECLSIHQMHHLLLVSASCCNLINVQIYSFRQLQCTHPCYPIVHDIQVTPHFKGELTK
jgi:hypothetical protein